MNRRLFLLTPVLPLYPAAPLKTFSAEQAKVVEALCDQIIPADDAPGARQAGVLFYIDQQLAGPLKRFQSDYQRGIPLLQSVCRTRTKQEFLALPFAEQTAFLQQIDRGAMPELTSFFQLVIDQTMQGFYGSPKHGGNRDEASWKMLGITSMMEEHHH